MVQLERRFHAGAALAGASSAGGGGAHGAERLLADSARARSRSTSARRPAALEEEARPDCRSRFHLVNTGEACGRLRLRLRLGQQSHAIRRSAKVGDSGWPRWTGDGRRARSRRSALDFEARVERCVDCCVECSSGMQQRNAATESNNGMQQPECNPECCAQRVRRRSAARAAAATGGIRCERRRRASRLHAGHALHGGRPGGSR